MPRSTIFRTERSRFRMYDTTTSRQQIHQYPDGRREEEHSGADLLRCVRCHPGKDRRRPAQSFQIGDRQREAHRRSEIPPGRRRLLSSAGRDSSGAPDVSGASVAVRIREVARRQKHAEKLAAELLDASNNTGARGQETGRRASDGGGEQSLRALSLVTSFRAAVGPCCDPQTRVPLYRSGSRLILQHVCF